MYASTSRLRPLVMALAALLWAATFASLTWCAVVLLVTGVWHWAGGTPGAEILEMLLVPTVGTMLAGAVIAALAFAPGIRYGSVATRLVVTGALALPAPAFIAWNLLTF